MQMDDDKAHFRIVNGPLCSAAPRFFSGLVIRKNANGLNRSGIEFEDARILDPTTKYQM